MQIELKLLQSQLGITFIFVTHDQEEALSMSDRIAVMLDGRIEQLGDPYTIYEHPSSAFVAGFIGQQNFFRGVALDGGAAIKSDGGAGRRPSRGDHGERDRPGCVGERAPRRAGRHLAPRRRHPVRGVSRAGSGDPGSSPEDQSAAPGDRPVRLVLLGG
jgi:hypothetical protein